MSFLNWISINNLDYGYLSGNNNPNIMFLLEKNLDKIDWKQLSENPSAIYLLQQNQDKIDWNNLSENPSIFEEDYECK